MTETPNPNIVDADTLTGEMRPIRRTVVALGSNLGDRAGHLRSAVAGFADVLVAASPVYETAPWGGVEQDDFLNMVIVVDDPAADARAWLRRAQALEDASGRVREVRWGPRTLDVDVVTVTGPDGPSHNGMWDASLLGLVPGLRLTAPRDEPRLVAALQLAVTVDDAPTVLRYSKEPLPDPLHTVATRGEVDVLLECPRPRVLVVGYGQLCSIAVQVGERLAQQGIGATVVDPVWALPVSADLLALVEAGAHLVAELPLDVVEHLRQLAVAVHGAAQQVGDHLLVGGAVQHVAVVPVAQAQHLRSVGVVAPAGAPEVGRLQRRHQHLLRPGRVLLLAHDLADVTQHAPAGRQPGVDAGRGLPHQPGPQHQAV